MSDPGEAHDLAALARSRWPTLVRTAVLLGMTLPAARGLAGRTVAEVSGRSSGYEGLDPEVELFGALVDGHRGDTSAWWREPPDPARAVGEAVLEAEAVLDVLSREARERVVLEVVALLAPEQLDEVVPAPAEPGPDHGLAGPTSEQRFLVERAAASLDVGAPAVAEVTGDRRRVAASVLAGVLLAALGLGGAVVAAQRLADDVPLAVDETDRRPSAPFTGSVNTAVVPVGWYAAGVLRLGEASVSLDDVETLASLPTGAVVVTGRGVVLAVDELGATTRLGRTRPGARVVTSPDGRVAFVDSQGPTQVSVLDLGGGTGATGRSGSNGPASTAVDVTSEVVALDGDRVYVNDGDGHLVLGAGEAPRRVNGVMLLDVVRGVRAIASAPGQIEVLRDADDPLTLAGTGADLSPDARHVLVRGAGDQASYALVEVASGRRLELLPADLPADFTEGAIVTDAAFALDGRLVVVVRGPLRLPSSSRTDPERTSRRSVLVACAPDASDCETLLRVGGSPTGPVLAR